MSVLRILLSGESALTCKWALIDGKGQPTTGEGLLSHLPRGAEHVQIVVPAAQVLLTRAQLPRSARRRAGAVLAFAVEEETLGDPQTHNVIWLGTDGQADVLAVIDRGLLARWCEALEETGIRAYEIHCETLLLPLAPDEWSLAWDGHEGFMRTGELEGAATDCGDGESPPLSLRLALDAASMHGPRPSSIAIYVKDPLMAPDADAWQSQLGIPVRLAGRWDWRTAPTNAESILIRQRGRWRGFSRALVHLKPAVWIAGAALAIHALALVTDWTVLARQQRALRQQMEARFRAVFPDAVAVVDPAIQMRRKLAEARHAAGKPDSGDFLPMAEKAANALKDLHASPRTASYESGRLTLEFSALDETSVRRLIERLLGAGFMVERAPASLRSGNAALTLNLRAL